MRAEDSKRVLWLNTCTPSLTPPPYRRREGDNYIGARLGSLAPACERKRIESGRLPHPIVSIS
jgi:hypothetical protein